MGTVTIRRAHRHDTSKILEMMHELAIYQRIEDRFNPDESRLGLQLSTDRPNIIGFIALDDELGAVGYSLLYLTNYSSFHSRWQALKLEDLYIKESARGSGVGMMMMQQLAKEVADQGVDELVFDIHPDNADGFQWYSSLGAIDPKKTVWIPKRLRRTELERIFG